MYCQCERVEMDYLGGLVARMEETYKYFRRRTGREGNDRLGGPGVRISGKIA